MSNPIVPPTDRPGPKRPSSDAIQEGYNYLYLDAFYASMRHSTLHSPRPVKMLAHPQLLHDSKHPPEKAMRLDEEITIQLVVTNIRVIHTVAGPQDRYEYPEFEFDAWVLGGNPETVWVRGALRTNDTGSVEECTLYRLKSGEELGTARTPGIY